MKSDKKILERIKNTIHKVEPSATIILYGSRARGDNKPDSDWDILILVNKKKVTSSYEDRFLIPVYDIEIETNNIITPIVVEQEKWENIHYITPFYQEIKKEGKLL